MIGEPTVFSGFRCKLGEGGCWHRDRKSFFWVDILEGKIFEKNLNGDSNHWKLDCFVSAVFEVENDANHLWVVSSLGLLLLSLDQGNWRVIHPLYGIGNGMRTNDAGIDPSGNLVYGTMHCNPENGSGKIYRLDKSGSVHVLVDNVGIPNTFQWINDGKILYSADSYLGLMYKFRYANGLVFDQKIFISLSPELGVVPDGSAIDSEGYLWNACWGGSKVQKIDKNGQVVEKIELPVSKPTSCTFGSRGELFITSASVDMSVEDLKREPFSGSVLLIETDSESAKKPYLKLDQQ